MTHLATGWGHSLLGTDMNSVYSFGLNKSGQLGNGSISNRGGSKIYSDKENKIKFLACGREHSHVVTEKNKSKEKKKKEEKEGKKGKQMLMLI